MALIPIRAIGGDADFPKDGYVLSACKLPMDGFFPHHPQAVEAGLFTRAYL
jgi:hypothetical protein